MAAQRLRKTFKYPSESDDEDAVEAGMDEQDKAHLISTLASHDTSATHTYTLLLLILPLAPVLLYLPRLSRLSTIPPTLLAIASLLASAYTLYFLPLPPVEPDMHDNTSDPKKKRTAESTRAYGSKVAPWEKQAVKPGRRPVPYVSDEVADGLAEYIVMVNRAVCGALALVELWQGRGWSEGLMVGGGYLPGLICMIVLYARTELRIIDMDELERLRAGGAAKGGKGS
ncbi:Nn.00g063700.m01.CDS01 [Neocucurbitaria sp. VM-36]